MANGLGRGLDSLIPNKNAQNSNPMTNSTVPPANTVVEASGKAKEVDINKISVNPMQPRKKFTDAHLEELENSIRKYGVIQPLIVTKKDDGYELIAGERRLRASKRAGLEKVPVIIRDADKQEKLEVALIENIQRENLNPIDLGLAYKQLMDEFSLTQEDVAKHVGKSRPAVANTLRMLNLPEEIKQALINEKITEGHAKYLVGMEDETKQMSLFRKILHTGLTVSDTNKEAKRMGGTKAARVNINYRDKDKEFAFREFFGTKVEIKRKGKGGQIIIDFFSDDELQELTAKIKK